VIVCQILASFQKVGSGSFMLQALTYQWVTDVIHFPVVYALI